MGGKRNSYSYSFYSLACTTVLTYFKGADDSLYMVTTKW